MAWTTVQGLRAWSKKGGTCQNSNSTFTYLLTVPPPLPSVWS